MTITIILLTAMMPLRLAWAADQAQVVRTTKRATALVQIDAAGQQGFGSAFCVDASGLFVTNSHVVQGIAHGQKVKLVLSPAEADEKVYTATVLRNDTAADLALLKITSADKLPALELGSSDGLVETTPVTAFGYPFGDMMAMDTSAYPSITVSSGRITALRKKAGELQLIQLDASLNPGNSGGPVIDVEGKVIGVVEAGINGTGLNFALPVADVIAFLSRPEIVFEPPHLAADKRSTKQDYTLQVLAPGRPQKNYDVVMTLDAPGGAKRTIPVATSGGGQYHVSFVPVLAATQPSLLRITASFSDGSVTGLIPDAEFRVGEKAISLSQLQAIELSDTPLCITTGGETLRGAATGLGTVQVSIGGASVPVDLSKATHVAIESTEKPVSSVRYTITVNDDGKLVATRTGTITIGASAVAVAAATTDAGPAHSQVGSTAPEKKRPAPRPSTSAPVAPPIVPITAPELGADVVNVQLPAVVDDVVVGGGGRYLVLVLRKLKQIALFDVSEAKVIKYLPVPDANVLAAAGADKLVLALPGSNVIQRYTLATLEKEVTVACPTDRRMTDVVMGSASCGPVLLDSEGGRMLLDLFTLREFALTPGVNVDYPMKPFDISDFAGSAGCTRASADGSTFASYRQDSGPSGICVMSINGTSAVYHYGHRDGGLIIPSDDGQRVFTRLGILQVDAIKLVGDESDNGDPLKGASLIPACHPNYFLAVRPAEENQSKPRPRKGSSNSGGGGSIGLYTMGDRMLLYTFSSLPELSNLQPLGIRPTGLTLDKRIHFIPAAKLLITLPQSNDKLVLRHLSVTEAMDKAGIDYLYVDSLPPRTAAPGQAWQYQIEVASKRGGIQYHLDSGPEGMTVSPVGLMTWKVPADFTDSSLSVIVTISDASGQQLPHAFTIRLPTTAAADDAAAADGQQTSHSRRFPKMGQSDAP